MNCLFLKSKKADRKFAAMLEACYFIDNCLTQPGSPSYMAIRKLCQSRFGGGGFVRPASSRLLCSANGDKRSSFP